MTARLYQLDDARELREAARRPRRQIGECCVRDGKVHASIPTVMTPEAARAWSAHLSMLADSAERGEEA